MNIFVDTSAFYALADKSDAHHLSAGSFYAKEPRQHHLYTTAFSFDAHFRVFRYGPKKELTLTVVP